MKMVETVSVGKRWAQRMSTACWRGILKLIEMLQGQGKADRRAKDTHWERESTQHCGGGWKLWEMESDVFTASLSLGWITSILTGKQAGVTTWAGENTHAQAFNTNSTLQHGKQKQFNPQGSTAAGCSVVPWEPAQHKQLAYRWCGKDIAEEDDERK